MLSAKGHSFWIWCPHDQVSRMNVWHRKFLQAMDVFTSFMLQLMCVRSGISSWAQTRSWLGWAKGQNACFGSQKLSWRCLAFSYAVSGFRHPMHICRIVPWSLVKNLSIGFMHTNVKRGISVSLNQSPIHYVWFKFTKSFGIDPGLPVRNGYHSCNVILWDCNWNCQSHAD